MTVIVLEVKNLYHLWRKNKRFRHLVCYSWEMMMTNDRCVKKILLRSIAKWQSHLPSRSLKKKGDDSCHRKWRWPSFSRWHLPTSKNCNILSGARKSRPQWYWVPLWNLSWQNHRFLKILKNASKFTLFRQLFEKLDRNENNANSWFFEIQKP